YPSTEQGLAALVTQPSGYPEAKKWNPEGYLPKLPVDPWGNPYVYLSEGPTKFEIYSYGADGKEGGDGYNADILYSELK
ncbi:MAG TPA: type II secretion system protein GspG, partial [Pseudomonadales bacterium]|nr:type II secretion system protein GspG [Pseudomonadales bacterium]